MKEKWKNNRIMKRKSDNKIIEKKNCKVWNNKLILK